MFRQGSYHLDKVIPRAGPFVAEVINAFFAVTLQRLFFGIVIEYRTDSQCQVVGVGRRTDLVEDCLQQGLGIIEIQHGFHKVRVKLAV